MHDKSIDDILGISRKFHDLIDHASISEAQVAQIIGVGAAALVALRQILDPTPEQVAKLQSGLDAIVLEKTGRAPTRSAVH